METLPDASCLMGACRFPPELATESRTGAGKDAIPLEEDEILMRKIIMDLENRVKSNHRVRGGIVCMDG